MATAKTDTTTRVLEIRSELLKKLGRPPKSAEIRAEMDPPRVTGARIRQILQEQGLAIYAVNPNKAMTDGPIDDRRSEIEKLAIYNIRRLYKRELRGKNPRSDKQMAFDGGFSEHNVHAAGVFRRLFDGSRPISLDTIAGFSKLWGVPYHELLKPRRKGS